MKLIIVIREGRQFVYGYRVELRADHWRARSPIHGHGDFHTDTRGTGSFESNHARLWTLSTLMFVPMPWNRTGRADGFPQSKCRRQVAVGPSPATRNSPRNRRLRNRRPDLYAPREATTFALASQRLSFVGKIGFCA